MPLLSICPNGSKSAHDGDSGPSVFITAQFSVAKPWSQPRRPAREMALKTGSFPFTATITLNGSLLHDPDPHGNYTQGVIKRHIQEQIIQDTFQAHESLSFQNCGLSMNPIPLTSTLTHSVSKSKLTRLNYVTHFDLDKNDDSLWYLW